MCIGVDIMAENVPSIRVHILRFDPGDRVVPVSWLER